MVRICPVYLMVLHYCQSSLETCRKEEGGLDTPECSFYAFTERAVASLVPWVAGEVARLCTLPAAAFSSLFARGPGLFCRGRAVEGYRLLEWKQTPGFLDEDAFARCLEGPTSLQRLRDLNKVSKQVTIHIALGHVPPALLPELQQRRILRAWRENTRRRINPEKPYTLPWAREDWHPQVREQHTKRETPRWRTLCINSATPTSDDVLFQLVLILLQEQMIPEDDAKILRATMVDYLGCPPWNCEDTNTAYLVLEKLERTCVEPETWQTFSEYIQRYKSRERQKDKPGRGLNTRHTRQGERGEDIFGTTLKEAMAQYQGERLNPKRSTVYSWGQEWSLHRPDLAMFDGDRGLRLTSEGMDEARTRLILGLFTDVQKLLGKGRKAAEKFTLRHTPAIRDEVRQGKTLPDIVIKHLGNGAMLALRQLQEGSDS